ncbi:hypothetical protein GCM10023156_02060 [Novipirellula rosea]|uniref:Uncharacterized protein n=1 Tax=Novipirellula rosea TaxID=1031540 RepID=A0ABP8M417_9BACT
MLPDKPSEIRRAKQTLASVYRDREIMLVSFLRGKESGGGEKCQREIAIGDYDLGPLLK